MRRLVIIIVVLVLVGVGVCVGGSLLAPKLINNNKSSDTPSTVETPAVTGASVIRARGKLVPVRIETLSFTTSGTVGQLTVEVGDEVSAGQVVARLDTTDLEWAVRQAEDGLVAARPPHHSTNWTALA